MDLALVARLERVLLASWPAAERRDMDGWAVLANRGVTGRANAITAISVDRAPAADVARAAERWQRARGLVPLWRLTPLSDPDTEPMLRRWGHRPRPEPTLVMVSELGRPVSEAPGVEIASSAHEDWLAVGVRAGDGGVLRDMMDRVTGPVGYAAVRRDGAVIAVGQGVLVGDHLSVFGMFTRPSHRGQGHAGSILAALHAWALGGGARTATLQVTEGNTGAQRLYEQFGYGRVYRYHYLRAAS